MRRVASDELGGGAAQPKSVEAGQDSGRRRQNKGRRQHRDGSGCQRRARPAIEERHRQSEQHAGPNDPDNAGLTAEAERQDDQHGRQHDRDDHPQSLCDDIGVAQPSRPRELQAFDQRRRGQQRQRRIKRQYVMGQLGRYKFEDRPGRHKPGEQEAFGRHLVPAPAAGQRRCQQKVAIAISR